MRNSLNKILKIYTERASKEEQDRIICQAMSEVFERYEGAYITKEHIQKLSLKIAEDFENWRYRVDTESSIDLEK